MANPASSPQIVYRLILAKSLYKNGLELCRTNVDIYNFSQGLITLHDALDNFTGAIATTLGITKKKSYFLETLNDIENHEKKGDPTFILTSKNALLTLKDTRNSIKHHGNTPNINQSKTLIDPIKEFLREYSQKYFGFAWDFVSLADLVEKDEIKSALKDVETLISQTKCKEALDKMAIIKFQVFDEQTLRFRLDPKYDLFSQPTEETKKLRASTNIFPSNDGLFSDLYDRADFIEKGIDRDQMRKLEDLTAKVGVNNPQNWKYILKHGIWWGEVNWTREIAIFCLDFLTDAILKNQGKKHPVQQKWVSEIYQIRPTTDLQIFDKDQNLIYTLLKGKDHEASVMGYVDGSWEIFDTSDRFITLYNTGEKENVRGFFNEGDESKIKFIKTSLFTRDENGNWVLLKETP